MFKSVLIVAPLLMASCVSNKALEGQPCPCAPGWTCSAASAVCIPTGADGGSPTGDNRRQMFNRTPDPLPTSGWPPSPHGVPQMVYDSARNRTVLLLWTGDSDRLSVWEWNGSAWSERTAASDGSWPPARDLFAAAYDSNRGVTVLAGGTGGGGCNPYCQDVWEWDGVTFVQRTTASAPPGRAGAAMAFDALRNVTLMFGGLIGNTTDTATAELWSWDGTTWRDLTPSPLPPAWPAPRENTSLVWDSVRQRMALFGGEEGPAQVGADLWEWDGSTWMDATPRPLPVSWPLARGNHAAAYDPGRGTMVIMGGGLGDSRAPETTVSQDLWEWDSTLRVFRNLTPSAIPTIWPQPSYRYSATFDIDRRRLEIMTGGTNGALPLDRWLFEYGE